MNISNINAIIYYIKIKNNIKYDNFYIKAGMLEVYMLYVLILFLKNNEYIYFRDTNVSYEHKYNILIIEKII
ncbi:hypothetical protein BN174_4320005 [Clostridioides difficile E15]|nr:hypothetical protein BN174_4320005 [Clostridioides difficile E15]